MKEFIEKLIERLEEREAELKTITAECKPTKEMRDKNYGYYTAMNHAKEIVNQLAEEYKDRMEFSQKCVELAEKMNVCDLVYENIRLSKMMMFLEAEKNNNDFCEWNYDEFEEKWQTDCGVLFKLHDSDREITNYCPYCGKKIKVVD